MKRAALTFLFLISYLLLIAQCGSQQDIISFTYDNHTYSLYMVNKTWTEAAGCAVQSGGYLAEINNQQEHDTILSYIVNNQNINQNNTLDYFSQPSIWLGGTDQTQEGNWIWDGDNNGSGTAFWNGDFAGSATNGAFNSWGSFEPDNSGGNQNYLTLRIGGPKVGKWNDLDDPPWLPSELFFLVEQDFISSTTSMSDNKNFNSELELTVAESELTLSLLTESNIKIKEVQVINMSGKLEMTYLNMQSTSLSIKIDNLASGIYVVTSLLDDGQYIKKKFFK